jgi:hypothetical protein
VSVPWPEYVPGPPRGRRPRGTCAECGRDVPLCKDGTAQSHLPGPGGAVNFPGGNCAGSHKPGTGEGVQGMNGVTSAEIPAEDGYRADRFCGGGPR